MMHRVAAVRAWKRARQGFVGGWRQTPPARRRAFLRGLAAAFAAIAGLSTASAVAYGQFLGPEPRALDRLLRAGAESLMGVHTAVWWGALTSSLLLTPLALYSMYRFAVWGDWRRSVLALVSYAGSKLIVGAAWFTWHRARPADVAAGELVPESLASYPSAHTLQVTGVLGLYIVWWMAASRSGWERLLAALLLVVMTTLVAASRVRLGAHHGTDAVAGALLGLLWLGALVWVERRAAGHLEEETATGRVIAAGAGRDSIP